MELNDERARREVPATFPLDVDSFLAGLDSPNHSPESRRDWVNLFYRDMRSASFTKGDLDAAWREAEQALPKHWRFSIVPYYPSGWEAEAHDLRYPDEGRGKHGTGTTGPFDTPDAALRALTRHFTDLGAWPACEVCGKVADGEPGRCMRHLRKE